MPWKECHVVDERVRFVARLLDGETMAALCGEFGISRKTGYKIFDRYKTTGVRGLSDRRETRKPVGRSHGATNSGSDQRRPSVAPQLGHCLQEECLPSGGPESSNGNLMSDVLQDPLVAMPAAESCRASAASDLGHQRGSEALFQHRKASPLVIVHSEATAATCVYGMRFSHAEKDNDVPLFSFEPTMQPRQQHRQRQYISTPAPPVGSGR